MAESESNSFLFFQTVTVEELMSNGACNEEEAAKEFLACVLVFNEVAMQNVMSRTCRYVFHFYF